VQRSLQLVQQVFGSLVQQVLLQQVEASTQMLTVTLTLLLVQQQRVQTPLHSHQEQLLQLQHFGHRHQLRTLALLQ